MKWMRLLFLCAVAVGCASAADLTGSWKAVFLGPKENRPKTVGEIALHCKVDGHVLTGTARAGAWPGDVAISNGEIDGDQVSFVLVGTGAWRSLGPRGDASGYPRLTFRGTLSGDVLSLNLVWDSIMIYGSDAGRAARWQLQATRAAAPPAP